MANKKISELPSAAALTGPELVEAVQGGINVQTTAQDIANLGGGGGGSVVSVVAENGSVDNTDPANPIVRNGVRTVTTAVATVIADNNGLVKFDAASPINHTLNQLAANTKVSYVNYGAGAVTFIAGSGVTITGDVALDAVDGDNFASALVIWDSATAVRIIKGISLTSSGRIASTITADVLALDFLNRKIINFDITTTRTTAFEITFANESNLVESNLSMRLTGAIAIELPTAVVMGFIEKVNGRWDESTNILTLTGTTASVFMIQFIPDSAGNIVCIASDRNL